MASIVLGAAFIWFLFLSTPGDAPKSQVPVSPKKAVSVNRSIQVKPKLRSNYKVPKGYQPSRSKLDYEVARGTKKKLVQYIKKSNPSLPNREVNEIAYWIDEYAKQEGVDPMLVAALISRESSFNKRAISSTGAKGLGQIKDFNFKSLQIKDPYNVKQNVRGTVKYLKELFSLWKDSSDSTRMVLASYYQGPNETKRKKNLFPDHVSNYVDDILKKYKSLSSR